VLIGSGHGKLLREFVPPSKFLERGRWQEPQVGLARLSTSARSSDGAGLFRFRSVIPITCAAWAGSSHVLQSRGTAGANLVNLSPGDQAAEAEGPQDGCLLLRGQGDRVVTSSKSFGS
jgi:hypothetical protein